MVLLVECVSKRSLNFANQRKAYVLRQVRGLSYEKIAEQVVNLQNEHPSWVTVRDVCDKFSVKKGCRPYAFKRCGRKPWKMTEEVQKLVLKLLLSQRKTMVVTSTSLAEDLAKEGVIVEASSIRKLLAKKGYKWLPRSQKRRYSQEDMEKRLKFAKGVVRLSRADLRLKLCISLDGVVLSMPPSNPTDRYNYCWGGFHCMWRKKSESNTPALAGATDYDKQVPLARSIPLWGGISEDGFAAVVFHAEKKLDNVKWSKVVRDGGLTDAIRKINPHRRGPWTVLCDNESFLRHASANRAYKAKSIKLWGVPARSPDCNPIEMFWGWVRRRLRLMDLEDLRKNSPPLGKLAYTQRVKAVLRSAKAQAVAKQFAKKLRSTCQQIVKNKGAAARN